jgi:hypothetical protein
LPFGMPGIGELIDGAMQQAPQRSRQFIDQIVRTFCVDARAAQTFSQKFPASKRRRKRALRPASF